MDTVLEEHLKPGNACKNKVGFKHAMIWWQKKPPTIQNVTIFFRLSKYVTPCRCIDSTKAEIFESCVDV